MYYAVKKGRNTGICETWDECKQNINGFKGAKFHKFQTLKEAEDYMSEESYESKAHMDNDAIVYPCAFVDGSYNPKTKICGYGVAFTSDTNGKILKLKGIGDMDENLTSMRNVYGELLGAIKAISLAASLNLDEINIYYDYNGIEMWANKQWKTVKPFIQDYIDFVEATRHKAKLKINFYKVAAHTGVKLNEVVDKLAKESVSLL